MYLVEKALSQFKAGFYILILDFKVPLTTSVLVHCKVFIELHSFDNQGFWVAKKSEFAAKTSITKYKNSIEDFLKKRESKILLPEKK